ncbi:MAG: ABC transporter ATP-binding protein, partial [Clostridia bacterium]|nr:ABC transporter ATP-binding protein [Clostridia bacterium]
MKNKKKSTFAWIWEFAGEHRPVYVLSVSMAVCGVICGLLPYFVMVHTITGLIGGCREMRVYLTDGIIMAVLWLLRCLFHSISTTLSHMATFTVLGNIRKRICEKLTKVPLGFILDTPSG